MKSVPWFGIAMIVIALFAFIITSTPPHSAAGSVTDMIMNVGLFIAGVIGIYGRLILNRLDVMTKSVKEHDAAASPAE